MNDKKRPYVLILAMLGFSLIVCGIVYSVASSVEYYPDDYWHGIDGYYPSYEGGGAPDGCYTIYVIAVNRTDYVVSSYICPSAPGNLHGHWSYVEGLNFTENVMYQVWLVNNGIVYAGEWK